LNFIVALTHFNPVKKKQSKKETQMSEFDLTQMNLDELKDLEKSVKKEITNFQERRKAEALAEAEATVQKYGFSLSELSSGKSSKKSVSVPRYQHPENASLTWTGRGRKPKWIIEGLEAGKQLEDFAI